MQKVAAQYVQLMMAKGVLEFSRASPATGNEAQPGMESAVTARKVRSSLID